MYESKRKVIGALILYGLIYGLSFNFDFYVSKIMHL